MAKIVNLVAHRNRRGDSAKADPSLLDDTWRNAASLDCALGRGTAERGPRVPKAPPSILAHNDNPEADFIGIDLGD